MITFELSNRHPLPTGILLKPSKVMSFTPSPISALALMQRQLADWQQFHADLTLQNADASALNYAQTQIDYLESEVKALQFDADRRAESSTQNGDAK